MGKVAQIPVSNDIEEAIRDELSTPARAASCLRAVEMCISFIAVSTAGFHASIATKSLESYIRETLLMERDLLQSRVVKKEIQLQHLDALCELLDELANPDPFAKVMTLNSSSAYVTLTRTAGGGMFQEDVVSRRRARFGRRM